VTFRLADSLPAAVLKRIAAERRDLLERLRTSSQLVVRSEIKRQQRLLSKRIEAYLDRGGGSCHLTNPAVSEIVVGALRHFDGTRYELHAWCVMPNHVHVVFRPLGENSLAAIVHSWKSFSAQRANRLLGRTGVFWQREYYDHLIRDGEQLAKAVRYVAKNPERARLRDWKWVAVYAQD